MAAQRAARVPFLRSLIRLTWPHRGLVAASLVIVVVLGLLEVVSPLIIQRTIDRALPDQDVDALIQYGFLLGLVILLMCVFWLLRARVMASLSSKIAESTRLRLMDRVERLQFAELTAPKTKHFAPVLTEHVARLEEFVLVAGPRLVLAFVLAGASLLVLYVIEWRLAVIATVSGVFLSQLPGITGRRQARHAKQRRTHEDPLVICLRDAIEHQRVLRMFGATQLWRERFEGLLRPTIESARHANQWTVATQAVTLVGIVAIQFVVLFIGVYFAIQGTMTIGGLVGFFALLINLSASLEIISETLPEVQRARQSVGLIMEAVGDASAGGQDAAFKTAERLSQGIELRDISFQHPNMARPTLDGVSLTIQRGRRLALVGPSGSGKSTLLGVLLGVHRPQPGGVMLWDGVDTRELSDSSMRSHIGVVFQETALFDLSVRENITLGKPNATEEQVEQAARDAEIHDAILRLPLGYDTPVGPGGGALSAGQRQRVALARALIRRPDILVLDEATSTLDPQAEADITETLRHLPDAPTIINVTHRLNTIRDYDEIVVMNAGRLIERGNHTALIALDARYALMVARQQGVVVSEGGLSARPLVGWLRTVNVLSPLDDATLEALCRRMVTERYDAGDEIIRQGETGDRMYFLARGDVGIYLTTPDGGEVEVGQQRDGDFFGEIALLRRSVRTATVRAQTRCLVCALAQDDLMELVDGQPTVMASIHEEAQRRRASLLAELERSDGIYPNMREVTKKLATLEADDPS